MYRCSRCGERKPAEAFYRHAGRPNGLQANCKPCQSAIQRATGGKHQRAYAEKNREKERERCRKYYADNVERERARTAAKYVRDKARIRAQWKRDAHVLAARRAARRSAQQRRTPQWANLFFIEEAYELAARRSSITGVSWEVDHIIPLRGRTVSGLHVEGNLQVIPMIENRRKGNGAQWSA